MQRLVHLDPSVYCNPSVTRLYSNVFWTCRALVHFWTDSVLTFCLSVKIFKIGRAIQSSIYLYTI